MIEIEKARAQIRLRDEAIQAVWAMMQKVADMPDETSWPEVRQQLQHTMRSVEVKLTEIEQRINAA